LCAYSVPSPIPPAKPCADSSHQRRGEGECFACEEVARGAALFTHAGRK
jgi:hypothetical protein